MRIGRIAGVVANVLLVPALVHATEPDLASSLAPHNHGAALSGESVFELNAPCDGCLSATAAIDIASVYLDQAHIKYIDVRAELLGDFPWRGGKGLRWSFTGDIPDPWSGKKRSLEYLGERGVPSGESRTPMPDQTWQVWYQTGWLGVDRINERVEDGSLPLEALAWPPIKRERSLLVHSLTGELAKTRDEVIDHESDAFYSLHADAKTAARERARTLLLVATGQSAQDESEWAE